MNVIYQPNDSYKKNGANGYTGQDSMAEVIDTAKQKKIEEVFSKYEQKTTRGFLRLIILRLFYEEFNNMEFEGYHGWALIKRIEEISHNHWKPSPGSIYPILKEFSDPVNDLIEPISKDESADNNDKITYRITDIGVEVYRKLEVLSPLSRPNQDFSSKANREKLKEGLKAHHKNKSVAELEKMKSKFGLFIEIIDEMIQEKESGKKNDDDDSDLKK